jgi:hypothetical protein
MTHVLNGNFTALGLVKGPTEINYLVGRSKRTALIRTTKQLRDAAPQLVRNHHDATLYGFVASHREHHFRPSGDCLSIFAFCVPT